MNFLSLVLADVQPVFDISKVDINASTPSQLKLSCSSEDDDIAIFFESSVAHLDKCRVDVTSSKKLENEIISLVGALSSRADGNMEEALKMKICSKKHGELQVTLPEVKVNRKFEQEQAMCMSVGDPHVTAFDKSTYSNYAIGPTWLVKSETFDVQLMQSECYGDKSCNTAIAIRVLDNVYVADMTKPVFSCNSANKCTNDYGTTIQASQDGGSIVKLAGNIEITTASMNGLGYNVIIKAPGQDASKYSTSQCNPDKKYTETVTKPIYVVSEKESYFGSAVVVPKPKTLKSCHNECQLPVNCENVFKAEPTTPATPAPAEKTEVPVPAHYEEQGKKICTGYKPIEPTTYSPPAKDYKLVPAKAYNATVNPDEAKEKCASVCAEADFKALGLESDFKFMVDACISDYEFTIVDGISLTVEGTRRNCMTRLQQKTKDEICTSQDKAVVDSCTKIQETKYLGDHKCECENGACTSYGCECTTGFSGDKCENKTPIPEEIQSYVSKFESLKDKSGFKAPSLGFTSDATFIAFECISVILLLIQ